MDVEVAVTGWAQRVMPAALLTEEERRQLVEWNATESAFPRDSCVHDLVAAQAERTPNATAVSDSQGSLSYAALSDRSGRLARHLRLLGVGPDVLVGVCLRRSIDMVVALLAVLKAGGAFVPLEPDHPHDRLALMLDDARPEVIITTAQLCEILPPHSSHVVRVDADRQQWMSHQPVQRGGSEPTNLAYVLYTSGSTGRPKGVMIEHRAIVNQLAWRVASFGLGPDDRVLQKTPFGFDVSLWELFCPLTSGATMVLLEPGAQAYPRRIAATVRAERITALHFVPSSLQEFLATVGAQGCETVRLVAASGEALSAALVRRFAQSFGPAVELRNLYGPTEASVDATSWRCDPADPVVPIGRPVANTQIYVLDEGLRPVPIGEPGELCIGGVGLARGYLNQPELTAERFVANRFRAGERMYRTGDVARYRTDGAIEYLGRQDDQVKIHGNRVEPGEIEAAILSHPAVRRAVVVPRRDEQGELRLVAYVVAAEGRPAPAWTELIAHLVPRLPAVMIPAAFAQLDAIPLTPNGKLDRQALPAPESTPLSTARFLAPRSETEQRLASCWARAFGVEHVGVDDNFFEFGGDSLRAVRLLVDVEREFGVPVDLAVMFEAGLTVAVMAALIDALRARPAGAEDGWSPAPLSTERTRPPLFFVHPGESAAVTLRHFTPALGPQQPIVVLLPERKGARFDPSRSLEDLATVMLATMRKTQPAGPYHLAGFSVGGLLAYEIAGQLRASGEDVAWLGLLDTGTPELSRVAEHRSRSLRQRIARQRGRGALRSLRHLGTIATSELRAGLVRVHLRESRLGDDFDERGAHRLSSQYVCAGHDAPMDVFLTSEALSNSRSSSFGWETVHKGSLLVHDVPGGHLTMVMEPDVFVVAQMLSESLRRNARNDLGDHAIRRYA
jgi:amino acid adenylation domain-containing protein